MGEEVYVQTFFEFRKAFFLGGRKSKGKTMQGSRPFLAKYLGLTAGCREARDKKLLDAMAYMMYDYVGVVVETAIRARTGGRLVSGVAGALVCGEVRCGAARCGTVFCHTWYLGRYFQAAVDSSTV